MDNQLFRDIQTDLDLNGPILSFSTQPVDTTIIVGQNATFTAVATVSFPGDSSPANTGTIAYQWYGPNGILTEGTKQEGAGESLSLEEEDGQEGGTGRGIAGVS